MEVTEEDDLLAAKREFVYTRILEEEIETFQELVFNH